MSIVDRSDLLPALKDTWVKYNMVKEEFNLFSVRVSVNRDEDLFKDKFFMEYQDKIYSWCGTTVPGISATKTAKKGAAHLCYGYWPKIWQLGIHKPNNLLFRHQALIQRGPTPVKIWRDMNRNSSYEERIDTTETGWFGINFHRASKVFSKTIGLYSEGCMVTQDIKDFNFIMSIILKSETIKSNKNAFISYLLLKEGELYGI